MGGMAAQIPIKDDPAANEAALDKVRADKLREVKAGHDGTWVAHPGLVPVARHLRRAHAGPEPARRAARGRERDARTSCCSAGGHAHRSGLRHNVRVGIQYLEAWLRGKAACRSTPDGGRRDRRDLARAGVAVAPPQGDVGDGAPRTSERFGGASKKRCSEIARGRWATRASTAGGFPRPRDLFVRLVHARRFERLPDSARLRLLESTRARWPETNHRRTRIMSTADGQKPTADERCTRSDSKGIVRPYSKADVERLRGSVHDRTHPRAARREAPLGAAARRSPSSARSAP